MAAISGLVNQLVPTPPVSRLRYGLFTAAAGPLNLDIRGIASGIQFFSDHCGGAETYEQTCTVSPEKPFEEGTDLMAAEPFWVIARKRCGTVGRTESEMQAAVRQQLLTGEQQQVEAVLWDGNGTVTTPTLTGAGATTVVPTVPGFGSAIAALEEAFYDVYGYTGTIHVNTLAYAEAAYAQLIERDGPQLKTPLGSVWSFGPGYGITGPDDVAPAAGFVWAFITGQVTMWRTDVLPQPPARQTLDRTLNQWDVLAERVYALTWDCPDVFAVQVPITAPSVDTTAQVAPA